MMNPLDMLVIVFMVMTGASLLGLCLMFLMKNETIKKIAFYFLAIEGMAIAWMNALSTPVSYMHEVVIGWGFGLVAAAALLLQLCGKGENRFKTARLMVLVSVVAGMINLFVI